MHIQCSNIGYIISKTVARQTSVIVRRNRRDIFDAMYTKTNWYRSEWCVHVLDIVFRILWKLAFMNMLVKVYSDILNKG